MPRGQVADLPTPEVVVHERGDGKAKLWRFTCETCGRRSGSFSMKDAAEMQARSHAKDRCPG